MVRSYFDQEDESYKKWESEYKDAEKRSTEEKAKILKNVKGYLIQQQSKCQNIISEKE